MAVLYPQDRGAWWAPETRDCFLCVEPIASSAVLVFWVGASRIVLHPSCAERLAVHLIGDAREATLASGDVKHWPRRTARALRSAVTAAEMRP